RHTRFDCDWSSDVCSSDLQSPLPRRRLLAVAALCALAAPLAQAQDTYPSKPITIVVPYAPGGSNDNFARMLGKGLSTALKQPVRSEERRVGKEWRARWSGD